MISLAILITMGGHNYDQVKGAYLQTMWIKFS